MMCLFFTLLSLSTLAWISLGQNVDVSGSSDVTSARVRKVNGSLVAPIGADVLTVGVLGGLWHLQPIMTLLPRCFG